MKKKAAGVRVWICGATGRMGQEIAKILSDDDRLILLGGNGSEGVDAKIVDNVDVVIDFSSLEGNQKLFKALEKNTQKAVLIGTTGLSASTIKRWSELAKKKGHKILFAPNTSIGIYTLMKQVGAIAKMLSPQGFDIELIETHHNKKKDAPSGTAILLAQAIQRELSDFKLVHQHEGLRKPKTIGIHAVRGGGVFGEHTIRFISDHEEVEVSHRAFSRTLFARGAVELTKQLVQRKSAGFWRLEDF